MRLRYDLPTYKCRNRFKKVLAKLGRILYVKGYRYRGRYQTTHEAVLVRGEHGTVRFGGLLWGYPGEGPRGTIELLILLGVNPDVAANIGYHTPRLDKVGEDWRLTAGWRLEQKGGKAFTPAAVFVQEAA